MTSLPGTIAVVTGASSGIGAEMARRLAAEGRNLLLMGRSAERLAALAIECRGQGVDCHVAAVDQCDRAAVAAALAEIRRDWAIDLFVSNAGILDGRHDGEVVESAEVAHRVLDTNLLSAIDTLHLVLPDMLARRRGTIVLVASLAAHAPLADAPAYSAAKAGLLGYGTALREAVAGEGVRVCVACPGYVATPMATIHLGRRPGEISAEDAAARILSAAAAGRATCGFPFTLYWSARLSSFVPERLRRLFTRPLRFRVGR